MSTERIIGKVSATEKCPSTTDEFCFWTDKGEILSPFDIIKVKHLPYDSTITYGVIEEIHHVTDAPSHFTSYISSDFGDTDESIGNMNRLGMNYVKAKVVCNTGNIYTPVLDGKQVSLCSPDDIRTALGLDGVKNPIYVGDTHKDKEAAKGAGIEFIQLTADEGKKFTNKAYEAEWEYLQEKVPDKVERLRELTARE